jgi:hypothetical protein
VERVCVAGWVQGRVPVCRIGEDVLGPLRVIGHLLKAQI